MKKFIYDNKKIVMIVSLIVLFLFIVIIKICIKKDDYVIVDNNSEDIDLKTSDKEDNKDNKLYYVDVKGAVVNPGVYAVESDKRVIDVIKMAGGLLDNSDTTYINLSKYISDEMVIVIYTKEELNNSNTIDYSFNDAYLDISSNNNDNNKKNDSTNSKTLININSASMEELTSLSGIGDSKAKAIISYREENGKFNSIEDIMNVKGIGSSIYEKIKNYITV